MFDCLTLASEHGIRLAPNQSATKLASLLNAHDPERARDLCFGTVDTWVAWTLSGGELHVTDRSNAAVTGLLPRRRRRMVRTGARRPAGAAVDAASRSSTRPASSARLRRCPARPPIAALVGDQQGSLIGPGLRAARAHQGHLRHRWDARHRHRADGAGRRPPQPPRHVPDRGLDHRDGSISWGDRGDHAVGRHQRRVAGRRPRGPGQSSRERRGGRPLRGHRRRGLRPGPARAGDAPVGLRRPWHPARPDPGHRPARAGPGRARGGRPPRRRPG